MKGKDESMQQVGDDWNGMFMLGSGFWGIVGMVVTALCVAVKNWVQFRKKEENSCYGCFGAANNDVRICPKKGGER